MDNNLYLTYKMIVVDVVVTKENIFVLKMKKKKN